MGGAEVALRTLLKSLMGIEVTALCSSEPVADFLKDAAEARVLTGIGAHLPSRGIVRALRRNSPDLVHLNMNSAFSCRGGQLSAHLARLPVTATEHSPQFHGKRSGHAIMRKRIMSRWLSTHIAVGDRMGSQIESTAGLRPGSLITVYNGVEPAIGAIPAADPGKRFLIGTLGRLDKGKRIDLLVRSLVHCPSNVDLQIIGSGAERNALQSLVAKLGLDDRVCFVDPGFGGAARDLLPLLDLFVMTSELEGLPLVICEASLSGVPTLTTDAGSCREALDAPQGGTIVPLDISPEALGAAIGDLVADRVGLKAMGSHARLFAAKRFAPNEMARAYETIWRRAAAAT